MFVCCCALRYRRVPGDMCSGGDEGLLKTVNKTCKDHEEEAGYGYLGAHWINGVCGVCVCVCVCGVWCVCVVCGCVCVCVCVCMHMNA